MTVPRVNLATLQQSLAIVDAQGRPTPAFLRFVNGSIQSLKNGVNAIIDAQNAADAATAAAAAANAAAAAASGATDASVREQALVNSYIEPNGVLTASTTTITIAAHTRYYADGTSAAVSGGSIAVTATGDTDYISYSDPTRAGGAVTYVVSTTPPVQTGDTHVVGAVLVPATGTVNGGTGPRKPGFVDDDPIP